MKIPESYKFRIYPTQEQAEVLFRTIGCVRSTWNGLVSEWNKINTKVAKGEIDKDVAKSLYEVNTSVALKQQEEYSYLKEVDSIALKYAQKHFRQACLDYAKGDKGKPVFKSKNSSKHSYTTCRAGKKIHNVQLTSKGLKLPKIPGLVKVAVSRNPRGNLVSVTITREPSGKWFASLQYEVNVKTPVLMPPSSLEEIHNPSSADVGVKNLATLFTGELIENVRVGYRYKKKIAKLDRIVSRRREQAIKDGRKLSESKNYQKAKQQRARAYEKVKNVRKDHLHKVTSHLAETYDFIGVESLNVQGMMKNHHLAFALADASLGEFLTMLKYKCERNGVFLQEIDQFAPSTQQCSECLEITGPKGLNNLGVREWECYKCGTFHDRDINAACNILRLALVQFLLSSSADGMSSTLR